MNIFTLVFFIIFFRIYAVNMQEIDENKDNLSFIIKSQEMLNLSSEIRINDDAFVNKSNASYCSNYFSKIEIKKVLLVDYDKFFVNVTEYNKHCSLGNRMYKQLKKYTNECLDALPRQLTSLFLRGIRRLIKNLCNSEKVKEDVLQIFNCSEATALAGWKTCSHTANRQLDFIGRNSSDENLVRDSCCMLDLFNQCIDDKMKSRANCKSSRTINVLFREMVEIIFKDIMNFVCSKWTTEKCNEHAESFNSLKIVGKQDFEVKDIFLLGPLINLMSLLSV